MTIDDDKPAPLDRPLRVLTMNIWTFAQEPDRRMALIRQGIEELQPDLMAFQEAGLTAERNQVAEILDGLGYHVLHQFEVTPGTGDNACCIASRWPFELVELLSLQLTDRCQGHPYAALAVRVALPEPGGPTLFVCNKPSWELKCERERELQALAVNEMVERHRNPAAMPTIVAGDFDATPDSANMRFWTGRQSLDGVSVHYRDAWADAGDGSPGHTWTVENDYARGLVDQYVQQPNHGRRIDYILLASRHDHYGISAQFRTCRVVLNQAVDGIWPSDHYAVYAEIDLAS